MKEEKLKMIIPTKEYEQQAIEYIQEFQKYHSNINGVGGLYRYLEDYDGWLRKLEDDRTRTTVTEKVPSETFLLIREADNRLIGIINIRLKLNDSLLQHGGHIGYGIRPTERRKGYAEYQLYCALKYCDTKGLDRVLVTCYKDNIGSAKTIQNSYGVLENEVLEDDKILQRYWIDVKFALEKLKEKYEPAIEKSIERKVLFCEKDFH